MLTKKQRQIEEARFDYINSAMRERQVVAKQQPTKYFDEPSNFVMKYFRTLPSQMYGIRMQEYFRYHTDLIKVLDAQDRGDGVTSNGSHVEIKNSFISNVSNSYNFLQFRLWQKLAGYCLNAVDANYNMHLFYLTPKQAADEVAKLGGTCHVVSSKVKTNKYKETRLTLDTNNFKRWDENYGVDNLECMKNLLKTI